MTDSQEWEGEHCQDCGVVYQTVYLVPPDVWAEITPKSGKAGLLCIVCADRRARERGIILDWIAHVLE